MYNNSKKILMLIDGAQAISHITINLSYINTGAYIFSGHKIYSGVGVGILYINNLLFSYISPYQKGGGGIIHTTLYKTVYSSTPHKFEVGTMNISGIISLNSAI